MSQKKIIYQPEVDGLRAISVLTVVIFHAFPKFMPGGFIGVDVFFVISGYLITSIILQDCGRKRWDYINFYERRILRLFPALIIVLLASYVVGWNTLFANEFKIFGKHLLASAGFFSNYTYWLESGYFDTAAERKILLNLWSLAVEQQFYILWPILLIFLIKIKKLKSGIIAITLISFFVNIYYLFQDYSFLYFSVFTRLWEMTAGGYLGYREYLHKNKDNDLECYSGNAMGVVTLGALFACSLFYTGKMAYPGFWGVVPVVSAIYLIKYAKKFLLLNKILTWKPLVYVGLISYPLYLWHWPLLSYLNYLDSNSDLLMHRFLALFSSFVLAGITYEIIEKPIKKLDKIKKRVISVSMILILFLIGFAGHNTFVRNGLKFRESHRVHELTSSQVQKTSDCASFFSDFNLTFCRSSGNVIESSILVFGDSHAHQYFSALSAEYTIRGEKVVNIGWAGQPPIIQIGDSRPHQNKIPALIDFSIKNIPFHTVVLSMSQPKKIDESTLEGLILTIKEFRNAGKKVIFIQDNPHLPFHPIDCIGMPPFRVAKRDSCEVELASLPYHFFQIRDRIKSIVEGNGGEIFDYINILCPNNKCVIWNGKELLYETDGYISQPAALKMMSSFLNK